MFYENRWKDTWIIFAFFGLNFISTMGRLIMVRLVSLLPLNVTPAASRFLRYTKR